MTDIRNRIADLIDEHAIPGDDIRVVGNPDKIAGAILADSDLIAALTAPTIPTPTPAPADPSTATPGDRTDGNSPTVTTDIEGRAGVIVLDRLAAGLDLVHLAAYHGVPSGDAGEQQTIRILGASALEAARAVGWQPPVERPLTGPLLTSELVELRHFARTIETIKTAGGTVEVRGVRIEPCDETGRTATTATVDQLRAEIERLRALPAQPLTGDEIEAIATAWLRHIGHTDDQIRDAASHCCRDTCEFDPNSQSYDCTTEDGESRHPISDELAAAAEMANVALDALISHWTVTQLTRLRDLLDQDTIDALHRTLMAAAREHRPEAADWLAGYSEGVEHALDTIRLRYIGGQPQPPAHPSVAELRARIASILERHRTSSTQNVTTGEYKNPVREGYDRGLTEVLALIDEVARG